MDGDPVPRTTGEELLAQVRDELRALNQRAEQDRERGAGELREPAEPKTAAAKKKPSAKRPAGGT